MYTKTALITGGSSGLGLEMARILGKEGYYVIIAARNQARLDRTVESLSKTGIRASGINLDITVATQLQNASERLSSEKVKLDFLILNAGEVTVSLLKDYPDPEALKKDLETDLWGTIQSAYYFTPLLNQGSKVLMISSGFGLIGAAGYSVYCAAKAGVINFGQSLRRELKQHDIQVYVACPGDMDTPQFRHEIESQPAWMKEQSTARKVMSVDKAARKILSRCNGSSRFLILAGQDVRLLAIASRILPASWHDQLLDRMLPRPGKKMNTPKNH